MLPIAMFGRLLPVIAADFTGWFLRFFGFGISGLQRILGRLGVFQFVFHAYKIYAAGPKIKD